MMVVSANKHKAKVVLHC
uniref:Uncharacterized protein n=1 Tax=Anguilla anguilla TaxID=7936 RepID=A0A0E9RD76_ANGAN